MTENEKKIITLLFKEGALTKPEICKKGRMGWATAVKLITRLVEAGMIEDTGVVKRVWGQGKNPARYELTRNSPMAIGMDVEYRTTRIILLNLRGEAVAAASHETPRDPDEEKLAGFLTSTLSKFIERNVKPSMKIEGIGIGLPGIGMHSWVKHNKDYSTDLSRYLESKLPYRILIDINVRVYAVYEKWDKRAFSAGDFMIVSIRSGIGSGIFLNEHLLMGHQEHAGEIGHMTVMEDGATCFCGRRGCLQTEVNQNVLYRRYREKVLGASFDDRDTIPHDELVDGLADLFHRGKNGDTAAQEIIRAAAGHLGECLAAAIMVLNVPHIIVSARFGNDGDYILGYIHDEIRKRILQRMEFSLSYHPLDDDGFTWGAALLVLREYFTGMAE